MNIQAFWDVTWLTLVQSYQRFEGAWCLQLHGLRRLIASILDVSLEICAV